MCCAGTQELPENCPYLPLDEQWNNTKERGFLGSAAGAILGGVKALVETRLRDFPNPPLDEQWNNTKERGFLGSAAGAILGGVKALVETRLRDFPNPKGFISLHAVDSMYQYSPLPQETSARLS